MEIDLFIHLHTSVKKLLHNLSTIFLNHQDIPIKKTSQGPNSWDINLRMLPVTTFVLDDNFWQKKYPL